MAVARRSTLLRPFVLTAETSQSPRRHAIGPQRLKTTGNPDPARLTNRAPSRVMRDAPWRAAHLHGSDWMRTGRTPTVDGDRALWRRLMRNRPQPRAWETAKEVVLSTEIATEHELGTCMRDHGWRHPAWMTLTQTIQPFRRSPTGQ